MGGDRSFNEALEQVLKLETAKAAAGPTARLRTMTGFDSNAVATILAPQ
jgi:hypothetical protein